MLYLNLNPILEARGITNPYTFFVKHGISYGVANKLVYSTARSFRFDTIEKLCEILNCDVHDLLLWQPNAQQATNPNHPLQVLRATNDHTNNPSISVLNMPYKKLKELAKNLSTKTAEKQIEEQ